MITRIESAMIREQCQIALPMSVTMPSSDVINLAVIWANFRFTVTVWHCDLDLMMIGGSSLSATLSKLDDSELDYHINSYLQSKMQKERQISAPGG
jgi:hypothetical protein